MSASGKNPKAGKKKSTNEPSLVKMSNKIAPGTGPKAAGGVRREGVASREGSRAGSVKGSTAPGKRPGSKELKEVHIVDQTDETRNTASRLESTPAPAAVLMPPSSTGSPQTVASKAPVSKPSRLADAQPDAGDEGKKAAATQPSKDLYTLPPGAVGRRAPPNPFSSPILGKYRRKNKNAKAKVADPRLNNNPLTGRLIVCISTTAILIWVFMSQMIFNFNTFNGRCITKVLYPIYTTADTHDRRPYVISIGHSACEYNLGESAMDRHFVGTKTADEGWPRDKVEPVGDGGKGEVSWDSMNSRTYTHLGGLDTNLIRNYGELYRLFWAMYLHGGFMHIIFNIICQIQILWMIEPDWGFLRTLLLFFITGVTGNLLSAVCDPCSVTVGSSGALYGLIGALFTYCIEYWKTIPRPCCVLVFMIAVIIFGILIGMFGYTDNYAHMGGCLAGILYGFATITTVSAADKCTLGERMLMSPPFSWFLSAESKSLIEAKAKEKKIKGELYRKKQLENKVRKDDKLHLMMALMKNRLNEEGRPPCRMKARECIVRLTAAFALITMWIVLFIYLLNEQAYMKFTPPGQIRFSGMHQCYCCKITKSNDTFSNMLNQFWCFSNKEDRDAVCD